MPIYEYECNDCSEKFELLVYSSDEKSICEKCGSADLKRLLSCFAAAGTSSDTAGSCSSPAGFS